MRFVVVLLLTVLVASPLWAQSDNGGQARSFGHVYCPGTVPCPNNSASPISVSALAGQANACVAQYFGYTAPNGLFDENAGISYAGCLTAVSGVLPKGAGAQLAPACCIVPMPNTNGANNGQCSLRCEINVAN